MSVADFDLLDFFPYLLNQAAERTGLGFQAIYKARYGLLRTEWRVLFHLGRYGEMTAKEICDRARTHKTKVSRAVRALEDRRYLKRSPVAQDRRHEMLSLTKAGRVVCDDLVGIARSYDKSVTAGLSDEESRVLRDCLKKLAGL